MVHVLIVLVGAVMGQAPTEARSPVFGPGGMTPMVGTVEAIRDGNLIFRELIMIPEVRLVTVTKQVQVEVNGKPETRTVSESVTITQMAARSREVVIPLAKVQAFDLNAKSIATSKLASLFARPSLILYSNEGITVDPAYLKVARPGVIFLVLPMPTVEPVIPPAPTPLP